MMNETSEKKVVVITGASAGLGRATARFYGKKGYKVGLLARGRERLEDAVREIRNSGGEALALVTDVSKPDQVFNAAATVEKKFGPIDIWINNAMVSVFSPVKDMTPEDYRRVTDVTYLGYVHGTLAALKYMLPRDRGVIIQVGSALAYRSIPLQSAYCACKHAINGFTASLRSELDHDKSHVRVSIVEMPAMNTPQFGWVKSRLPRKARPAGTIYQPEIAARAIDYAVEHDKRTMDVGMSTLLAVNGNKFLPRALDWYFGKTLYKGQQTKDPENPNRPNNLYEAVPGHQGAHGAFDEKAHKFSAQVWVDTHKGLTAVLGLGAVAAGALLLPRKAKGSRSWRALRA